MPSLNDVIKDFNKTAKEEIITTGLPEYRFKRIPFTSPRMNYCTFGGIPIGKITEFFGEEHGGKTTSALDIVANYQQMEGARDVLYIDAENTLDAEWATKIGVDTDKLIMLNPTSQSAEQIFQLILDAIETGQIGLWVLDSIGSLASKQELEKSMEEKTYAGISAPLTVFGRKAEMLMKRHECTGIAINQLRDDINSMWGGTKTPGGRAWKHYCMCRFEFSKGKYIDADGNDLNSKAESPAGNYVLMRMEKNKSCPPTRRTGFYTLNYEYGIDYLKDLVEVAIKYGLIQKSGAWYSIVNTETGELVEKFQGMAKVYDYLGNDSNESALNMIEDYIDKKSETE